MAMLKAISAQEDRQAAQQKAADVARKLREMRLEKASRIVQYGVDETLSHILFPREHWTRIRTNNPLDGSVSRWQERVDARGGAAGTHRRYTLGNASVHGHETAQRTTRLHAHWPGRMRTAQKQKPQRSKILFESRVKMGRLLDTETGKPLQRSRETFEGFRGPLSCE